MLEDAQNFLFYTERQTRLNMIKKKDQMKSVLYQQPFRLKMSNFLASIWAPEVSHTEPFLRSTWSIS